MACAVLFGYAPRRVRLHARNGLTASRALTAADTQSSCFWCAPMRCACAHPDRSWTASERIPFDLSTFRTYRSCATSLRLSCAYLHTFGLRRDPNSDGPTVLVLCLLAALTFIFVGYVTKPPNPSILPTSLISAPAGISSDAYQRSIRFTNDPFRQWPIPVVRAVTHVSTPKIGRPRMTRPLLSSATLCGRRSVLPAVVWPLSPLPGRIRPTEKPLIVSKRAIVRR
jgi:hypothetical protein